MWLTNKVEWENQWHRRGRWGQTARQEDRTMTPTSRPAFISPRTYTLLKRCSDMLSSVSIGWIRCMDSERWGTPKSIDGYYTEGYVEVVSPALTWLHAFDSCCTLRSSYQRRRCVKNIVSRSCCSACTRTADNRFAFDESTWLALCWLVQHDKGGYRVRAGTGVHGACTNCWWVEENQDLSTTNNTTQYVAVESHKVWKQLQAPSTTVHNSKFDFSGQLNCLGGRWISTEKRRKNFWSFCKICVFCVFCAFCMRNRP